MTAVEIQLGDFEGSILRTGRRYTPKGFSKMIMSQEHKSFATRMALETFAMMTNHGHSFHDALTAVYLTGCDHGVSAGRESSWGVLTFGEDGQ